MANVKVAVRVRPICKREEDAKATVVVNEYQENVLGVANPKIEGIEGSSDHRDRIKHFSFDYCYFSLDKTAPNYASQQTIFSDLGSEVLDSSFDGYNVCLFAYGQTGSGKTHTMMGGDGAEQGVIPRLCESLLERVSSYEEDVTFKVEVSFLEIYNERVRDLLAPPNKAKYSLKVREHPKDGPYVQDLSHHLVSDYEQVLSLMHDGNLQRTTAATHMHELSSRSHAIFTITFIQAKMSHGMPSEIVSKINLVDLAGSERASINSSKDRLQEGANINKSLVTLGNCIQALGEDILESAAASSLTAASMESLSMSEDWDALSGPRRRTNYVPYRNSILTWLLKDSLGGNSKTIMIATISPASIHYNETMSTLRYARRAKHIINQPIVNEDRNVRLIRELRDEIDRLRMLLNSASLASSQASLIQDQNICRMLQENEQRVDQLTEAWVEKWSNAARIMQECNVGIRKESVGVIVESELPHLIGMDDDLLSTGIILYHLKEGRTKIGRANSDIHQDIVLYGPDVEDEHAVIINADGHVILTPLRNSKCAVNGINVHRPVEITQGAVILLGSTNMFRFNHPAEAVKLRERRAALSAEFGKRISLSMSLDGSWSAEPESNLKKTPMRSSFSDLSSDISPIMMFNPGLELERVHRLETEKLEDTRKQLAELEARRAEAEAAGKEQESMMKRSLCEHQDRIREQKELIERLKMEHQGAMALAQEELTMMKGKINSQKEMGKHKLEGELTQLKEVPSYDSDLCTIPSVVADVCSATRDLSGLDVAKKRVALMELLQKQSQRKALAALERRQATLEVQERTAQLILKHEEQKLEDFETDPRLLEGEFGSEQSPEKELGDRDIENTVDSSTENVSTELPASGRVSPVGNSDPETMHHNNVHSPKKETKRIQKQENKDKTMDQKKDQTNSSKKNSRKTDARPTRKVELGPSKTKPREEQIKRESDGRSASPSRSPSPTKSSRSSSPSKSSRSSSPTKSLRSDSPTKSSRSSSPTKSLRSDSPTKSSRSTSPTKSLRSESPTKSSRSSSPASTSSRQSRQSSGNVFSRLYPQQETKFNFLRKKSPPRYGEYDPHRERDRDSPHLIRRELSPSEHDPIKLKDRKREHVQDHKHVRTSSVPSSNLPDRTKQNLHSRSRSASPCVNNPVKPATRPKKSPVSQETEKAGRRAKVKSKETASAPPDSTKTDPGNEKQNNKCQTKTKRAKRTSPSESTYSSPTKKKLNKPENTSNAKTPKGSSASPSRSRPIIGKAVDRSPSPRKKSEQTPSHRKTVKRPLSRSGNDKDGKNTNSLSPRRKFARTPVVKPKNWPSIENLPKSTPKSDAFYVPLTSEQLRLELQKHASEQDSGPHLEGADLGASGCEQHWSPTRKRSIGKQPQQTQTDSIQDSIGGEIFGLEMDGVKNPENEEDHYSSSESLVDSLEEDLKHDQEVEIEYDDGPRVVDMTSADEDEFWAIPVSSEDILTASSDEGEDDDEDDIALNLDVLDRKQSSDTLESLNSNDELEADDPCHTTMVEIENTEAFGNEEEGNAGPEVNSCSRLVSDKERPVSDDSLGSPQFSNAPVACDHEEAKLYEDNISCDMEHVEYEQVPLDMEKQDNMNEQASILDKSELDENRDRPTETHLPDEDEVSLEPSKLDVNFEQETVGPTDQEAEACEKDEDEQVSEGEHVEIETETPYVDIDDRNATLPQGPQINEIRSMPDLPDECDKEMNKPLHEDDSCVVPERYEQKHTEEDLPNDIANMNDQESAGALLSDGVLSVAHLPDEYIVSDSADPDVTPDNHLVIPPDTNIEACEEHRDNKMAEIKLDNAEQYPDIGMDDSEQHVSGDLCDKDLSSESSHSGATSDNDLDRPSMETVNNVEEGNPEENLLKTREEDVQINDLTDDLNQEPHTNEIQSSTDQLDKTPISSDPLLPDVTCKNETRGQTGEMEASDNDGIDDPESLKATEDDFQMGTSDASDPLLQEPLLESPSATDLSLELASSSDSSHPDVSCEKEVQGLPVKFEMGRKDEPGMVPEGKEQRDVECEPQVDISDRHDFPQEPHSYKIQSETDNLSGDTPSPVSSHPVISFHPDVICDRELDGPSESDVKVLQKDGDDGVPERNGLQTTENDHLTDITDISDQLLQEEPHMNGICLMSDLPDGYVPSEPFSPEMIDVTCDKQPDEQSSNGHGIGFIGKSDNIVDRKTDEELPKSEEYIDEHPGLSNLGAFPESHPEISIPEQLASRDLEPWSVCDDRNCTSLNIKNEEHSDESLIPIRPEDSSENEIETEANGYGDINDQPQVKGVCIEENLGDDAVSTEKETADSAVTMQTSPCLVEIDNDLIHDIAEQVPKDSDELDVNTGMSENDAEDSQQSDMGDHPEATTIGESLSIPTDCIDDASLEEDRDEQVQDRDPILPKSVVPDKSTASQNPEVNNGTTLLRKQDQDEVKGDEQSSVPLIVVQSDADEVSTVSCTVMANQLSQLQRPLIVNLTKLEQISSDSDEASSDQLSDDQSEYSEEEIEISQESPLDEECPPHEGVPSSNASNGNDFPENKDQQRPVGNIKDTKEMVPKQDRMPSDAGPYDKLKEHGKEDLSSAATDLPKMKSLPDQSINQNFSLEADKPLHSDDGVLVMPLADDTTVEGTNKKAIRQSLPQDIDHHNIQSMKDSEVQKIVNGPSDTNDFANIDKSPTNQHLHRLPVLHENGQSKEISNNHNFRITRASPVPFSDEEMESMESPSSCSSTSAAEYCFDEEQTLSDFLEDVDELDDEEAAMSDDMSALRNSEVNGEITEGSQDNGTDDSFGESETGSGIPEAIRKGTVPSIQASLPPNVYKSIFNADSPRKQNILTNSFTDESALYQSAMDTSLYQTAVESPSAFSNKNEIIPLKKNWDKDQILSCSTPTGTPEGTPVAKSSENLDKKDYGSPVIDQHGGSPTENKCRVPPQLGASPSSIMARKMPVSPDMTTDLHGYVGTGDPSTMNEDAPPAESSVCIGDISTDTKSGPTNFHLDITGHKEDDGNREEMRGLYYSPRDLPEQSYILHTLETIQEEDSMSEDSESEDTCSTLHSKSPQDSRETSPSIEHMSASSPEDFHHDIPKEELLTSLDHEKMTFITKVPLDEEISLTRPSEVLQNAELEAVSEGDLISQNMEKPTEPDNGILGRNDLETSAVMSQEDPISEENSLYNEDLVSTASKQHLKEEHLLLSENSMSIKQDNVPTNLDNAGQQDDIVLEAKESENSVHQPVASPMHKMAHNDNEVISTTIPPTSERTNKNLTPKNTMTMQESTADDVESIDKMAESDSNKVETSIELPETNTTSKRKDVFSRLYPKNAPKFDFKRKSAASVIPKERSLGDVSPKVTRKDLKARKSEMSETETDDGIGDKNLNKGNSTGEENVGGESPPMLNALTDNCDKTSEERHQMDDMSGMNEVRDNDPAVSSNEDHIPEAIVKSEPEMHVDSSSKNHLDEIPADVGATNEVDFHGDDGNTNNDTLTLSRDKYTDAHGSQAVENLKPFLGKDYAIANAKLTMFMKMFGLSVESTDSSEGSDSLRMHKDKGLVDRIVGDGVGYDPDTFQCDDSLTNTLSGSPGSVGNKGGETVPDDEECGNETWTGSDVAVDGDSSIRDLRSRSTTASDIELVSVGDDTMTDSTSAMSLHNVEVNQDLESSLTYPTHLPRMQPEPCITRSMQLAYPREDIALTLRKLDIDAPKSSTLILKEGSTINDPTGFSSSEMGKNDTVNPDVHEGPDVGVDGEAKPMKSCADMDQNHNIDSLQELKEDVDALATPYGIDESTLPLPSSMVNNKVPVQIQESAMTPFKFPEVKHPDMSPVGTVCVDDAGQSRPADKYNPSPAEDEGQDLSLEVTRPSSTPHLTPRVTEVILSSKVQLEDDMVSSIQRLKEVFTEGDASPIERDSDIHEESIPSTEVHVDAKEREKELPLEYAGVHDSPINYTNDSNNCKPLKRHVSEKITVDIVHLPSHVSLPSLFEKVEENDSNLENTQKGKYESQFEQPNSKSPVHNQHKVKQPICDEDKAMAEQDIPTYKVSETCTRNPVHLPENSLPIMLSKLGEPEGPLSRHKSYSETKRENACRPEHNDRMNTDSEPSPTKEQLQQRTLGKSHNQPHPKEPVLGISTQYNGNDDHDQNRLEEPRCVGNEAITTQDLPIVHVSETCTKHPIHLPEQSVPAMLSRMMESEGLLSQQSSEVESKRKDILRPEQKDKKCVDPQPSISEEAAQQRIQLVHPNCPEPNAAVVDNSPSNRHAHDPVTQKEVQPMTINLKKDQGMNTDDQSILADNESAHVTTKISHALSGTIDDLRQPDSDIRTQEPHAEQQMHFKINVHEEPILVKVAYPSNDEPIKWPSFTTDSSNDSTLLQSSKDSAVMVTPALDKSTQCQPTDMAEGHSDDNLDLVVPRGTEDRSTSPEEFPDSMHSFKPITPSPRLIIAAEQMEPTSTQVEDMNRDSMKDPVDSDWNGKKHEYPSSKINQSNVLSIETEGTVPKANLHKEAQSDRTVTTVSLQVPPLHAVDGVSPAYSPVLSSRSTDDELAQIFAGARERAPMKQMFTNTSPVIPAAQRSIVNVSTTTDDSINDISNEPVQDVEKIPTTVCAQTSPFEILTEQISVLDASTATDDSLKLISNNSEQDIDRPYEQTFLCEEPATNASVQTSPCKELSGFKDSERSATETVVLIQPDVPSSAVDSNVSDVVVHGDGNDVQQPTHEECLSENRSVGTSPIVQLDLPQAEHFSSLNIKTSTPSITNFNEQESQANLSSQSNNQECQTELSPSGLSSPSSTEDSDSGPWRKASEVLDELSENMDTEELELFAVLMHKRRLSEQTVDRVKGLAAKLRKRNQSDELALLNPDVGSIERPSSNPPSATNAAEEFSSPHGNSPDVIGSELSSPRIPQLEDTEKYPDENKYALTLSPLALSETGTREFDFGVNEVDFPAKYNQPLRNHEEEIDTAKDLQTLSPVDDEFLTLPRQKGSMSPPMVPALKQIPSPRSGLPFDRKPTPPTKSQSEGPIAIPNSPATYSKLPLGLVMDTSSRNDWHSMPLQSTWDESLNRNNNSSTDYSEDDIGSEEIAADNLNDDPDSIRSRQSPRATLSKFSDVSFDSELDFPVGANDQEDGSRLDKNDVKNQSVHASTHSLDSVLFADSAEPELLALQGDTDDSNANTGSLPVDFNHSTGFVGDDQGEVKDDPKEMEDQMNEAESFRIHVPQISPAKLEWLLAESEIEPEINYLPLSKHPEKDKIPLPGYKHQSTESPFVIVKQPSDALMQQPEGKVHLKVAEVEAYPVKFAMDNEQKGTVPSSSLAGTSARSRHAPGHINHIPASSGQDSGVTLPPAGNRHGNLERTGSSLGESSGIYSLASEIPHLHQVKTPSGSMDSLLNAASTDEERDMRQLQSEYERLLQRRNSSRLDPVDVSRSMDVQQPDSLKGSGDDNKNAQPRSNGILNGYSSGDSASSSEIDSFVCGHYSQSMDRRDMSIELLEAQVMHGIGETDALLRFLDDDLPLEYWTNRKSRTRPKHGEAEHGQPSADKKDVTHNQNNTSYKSPVYHSRRSPSSSLKKSPSGPQSSRSSPSSVAPPPLQRVVTPLLRTSPREQSPSPKGHFKPSEHLKFLKRVRENVVKATSNPTSPTPSTPSPRPQLYSAYPSETPLENHRSSSTFSPEKNDMELFMNELREARRMSQSEISKAEKELHPSRRRYSNGEDSVFVDAMSGNHACGGDARIHHPASAAERDGDCSVKQRPQRSDEDLIDQEIASMRAAAAVILPSSATPSSGISPCREGNESEEEPSEESPSKPYYYEMYDLPSRAEPPSKNDSQSRPRSLFGYSLYKDPPRSHNALTKTYPPSTASLQGDDSKREVTPLHQSGSVQLQKYTPLKSTGSSRSLSAPPNRRPTPQPSGVYLSTPQHRGVTRPHGGGSIGSYRGSPGSQVKISPVKSSLRNRRPHGGKPFQELPTVRESKLVWSRPECHLVAETALQTLVSEMAPCESFDPSQSQQPEEEGGWRYEGRERDILLLCKTHSPTSPINSYIGIGIIKAPARTVFNYVKNPMCRQIYDPMLKEVKVKKDFGGDLQVVYMVFTTDQCLLQHPRDCLCVIKTLEMDDRFLVVAVSIKHPRIPPKKKTLRAEVLLAGYSIQPLQSESGMEHCRVTHLSQVNLQGDLQPKLINALSGRLPICVADLRNIIQIGDA